jgi:hypothetical protein
MTVPEERNPLQGRNAPADEAGFLSWIRTNGRSISVESSTPHSLGKSVEWKLPPRRRSGDRCRQYRSPHPLSGVAVLAGQITHPNGKIEPKGEITMRKAFAINYVTHDGVMQSPGAFQ